MKQREYEVDAFLVQYVGFITLGAHGVLMKQCRMVAFATVYHCHVVVVVDIVARNLGCEGRSSVMQFSTTPCIPQRTVSGFVAYHCTVLAQYILVRIIECSFFDQLSHIRTDEVCC